MPRPRRWSYRLLHVWARTALRVFYRRLDTEGFEHVDPERPTILAASHTNALGDVAVIVAAAPTFPHFLAASSWWSRGYARLLFRLGGVLPVHRAADADGRPDNTETFAVCTAALAQHEHIAIFPAGVMYDEARGQPLKTGAARIGLGAVHAGVPDVAIVPVGIVYESRGRFRSDAAIRFGTPIALDDWHAAYADDPSATVRTLTARLSEELDRVSAPRAVSDVRDSASTASVAKLALLTPLATVGAVAHAPALLAGGLANRMCDEGWQATVKAVAGTALVPIAWAAEVVYLRRRDQRRSVAAVVAALAGSGAAVLAWVDMRRDLTR